jgi:DNA-binding transcriptional LysR family regulator
MELRHLRYFLAVAEELNFRKAAERVGIAQPPLSSQIQDLEKELGVQLFRRISRGVELTEAGVAFLAEVPAVFERVEHAIKMAKRGGRGEIGQFRVGFTGSTVFNGIVPRSIREFRRAYPEVEVVLEELNTPPLLERLRQQRLDAVFIRSGRQTPTGMAMLRLGDETMMALVPAGHRLASRNAIALGDLEGEPMVFPARSVGPELHDEVIDACRRAGFEPIIGQRAPQLTSISNLVAVELGVSIVPAKLANMAVLGVKFLPIVGDAPVAWLTLATRLDDRSITKRNFVSTVQKVLAEQADSVTQ